MAEVKRYALKWNDGQPGIFATGDGQFIARSDYAALERERNALDGALQREQYETARLSEKVAELTADVERLRKMEAAAELLLYSADELQVGRSLVASVGREELRCLAEACGRKG